VPAVKPNTTNYHLHDRLSERTVEIEIFDNNKKETFEVLYLLLVSYAPALANLISHACIRAVSINVVPYHIFDIFLNWLRM
jgi:hypothetical protein